MGSDIIVKVGYSVMQDFLFVFSVIACSFLLNSRRRMSLSGVGWRYGRGDIGFGAAAFDSDKV